MCVVDMGVAEKGKSVASGAGHSEHARRVTEGDSHVTVWRNCHCLNLLCSLNTMPPEVLFFIVNDIKDCARRSLKAGICVHASGWTAYSY